LRAEGGTLNILIVAVLAMLVQQAFAHLASLVVPTLAPAITAELGLDKALVGAYAGLHYALSFFGASSCGGFILRYGALRVSQVALLLFVIGLAAPAGEWLGLFALSAVLVGIGSSVSTPSSSQILARYAPPRLAPLVFSVKQTGVPVGGMMAGLLIPWLTLQFGWRGALVALGLLCVALALAGELVGQTEDFYHGHQPLPGSGFQNVDVGLRGGLSAVFHNHRLDD